MRREKPEPRDKESKNGAIMWDDEELDEDQDVLAELWEYSAWDLFKTSIKVFLHKLSRCPRRIRERIYPVSEVEVNRMRAEMNQSIREHAAKRLGGSPDDYEVRPIIPED